MCGKLIRLSLSSEDYYKLQRVKAHYNKASWSDQAFIRWVIHQLYQKLPYEPDRDEYIGR